MTESIEQKVARLMEMVWRFWHIPDADIFTAESLVIAALRTELGEAAQAEPDAYCVSTPDGGCVSTDTRCMHQPRYTTPPSPSIGGEVTWHTPGIGEVHSADHKQMIYCEAEKNGEMVVSDALAKQVAAALNKPIGAVDFEAKTCPEAFLQQELLKLQGKQASSGGEVTDAERIAFMANDPPRYIEKTPSGMCRVYQDFADKQQEHAQWIGLTSNFYATAAEAIDAAIASTKPEGKP